MTPVKQYWNAITSPVLLMTFTYLGDKKFQSKWIQKKSYQQDHVFHS